MTVPLWLVGVLVYAVGCLVSGKYHLSFLWFDREVLPGTLLLAAVIAAYFQLIYTISGESTRGTIVLLAVNVFQIMASGVVIPTAYLPELFGKSEPFSTDLLGQLLSEIIVFRNQRAGDKAADSHVCCAFCGQRVMGKSGRTFWKGRTGGT